MNSPSSRGTASINRKYFSTVGNEENEKKKDIEDFLMEVPIKSPINLKNFNQIIKHNTPKYMVFTEPKPKKNKNANPKKEISNTYKSKALFKILSVQKYQIGKNNGKSSNLTTTANFKSKNDSIPISPSIPNVSKFKIRKYSISKNEDLLVANHRKIKSDFNFKV